MKSAASDRFRLDVDSMQLLRLAARGDARAHEAALALAEAVLVGGGGEGDAGRCDGRARELAVRVLGMAARGDALALPVALDLADVVMGAVVPEDAEDVG